MLCHWCRRLWFLTAFILFTFVQIPITSPASSSRVQGFFFVTLIKQDHHWRCSLEVFIWAVYYFTDVFELLLFFSFVPHRCRNALFTYFSQTHHFLLWEIKVEGRCFFEILQGRRGRCSLVIQCPSAPPFTSWVLRSSYINLSHKMTVLIVVEISQLNVVCCDSRKNPDSVCVSCNIQTLWSCSRKSVYDSGRFFLLLLHLQSLWVRLSCSCSFSLLLP